MTALIAIIGGAALLFGLMAILIIKNSEDGRLPTDLAACVIAMIFGALSWIGILVLFILSFVAKTDPPVKAFGILALCTPLWPAFLPSVRILPFWGAGWVLSAACYVLFLIR